MKFKSFFAILLCAFATFALRADIDVKYKIYLLSRNKNDTSLTDVQKKMSEQEYLRYKTELILKEKADDKEIINQFIAGRMSSVQDMPLLYHLIAHKLYDLANALLKNNVLDINAEKSGRNALFFALYSKFAPGDNTVSDNAIRILVDHGASLDDWDPNDAQANSIKNQVLGTKINQERFSAEILYLFQNPTKPTKNLFLGKYGKIVDKSGNPVKSDITGKETFIGTKPIVNEAEDILILENGSLIPAWKKKAVKIARVICVSSFILNFILNNTWEHKIIANLLGTGFSVYKTRRSPVQLKNIVPAYAIGALAGVTTRALTNRTIIPMTVWALNKIKAFARK